MRDRARAAVLDVADDNAHVGDVLTETQLPDDVTVVRFASLHPGYPGWCWAVALVGNADAATINEIWMEPAEGALTVPEWKPWSERVRPGDLGAGDVMPTAPDDVRLMPGYTDVDATAVEPQWEPGLGRARVLSPEGLADAVDRWRNGDDGPDSQVARLADFACSTCAWLLPIGGVLGQGFGVCAHDLSPSDGHIVALDHGCGAHSDVVAEPSPVPVTELVVDELRIERVKREDLVQRESDAAAEPVAATDDMPDAEEPDADAGPGDVTPPEDVVLLEEAAAEAGE